MRGAAILALCLLASPAMAQDAPPLLFELRVAPDGPVLIGQRLTVTLTAMTPVRFVDPPQFPDLAPSARAIVPPEHDSISGMERRGTQSLAAVTRSDSLFAMQEGSLVLAPVTMRARVAGPDGQPIDAAATSAAVRIEVRAPAGVRDLARLIVAPSFRLRAETDRDPRGLEVGAAITRTVTMEADDTVSMLLPPALWGEPAGVRVYPDPPALGDRSDRGALHARRVDRAAFVPERPGLVALPGFAVAWWNLRDNRLETVEVPALNLEVQPAQQSAVAAPRARRWPIAAIAAVGTMLIAAAVAGVVLWRRARRVPTPVDVAFAALAAACRRGADRQALAALFRWVDAAWPAGRGAGPAAFAAALDLASLLAASRALERRLYGGTTPDGPWDGAALLAAVRAARKRIHGARRRQRADALPPLNPAAAMPLAPRVALPHWAR